MEKMSNSKAIKAYFGTEDRPVTMDELKALTKAEREELGSAARQELESQSQNQ